MPGALAVDVATGPLDAVVAVPGSKSLTNRALVCAALADGQSELVGVPDGDDTIAMVECVRRLGIAVDVEADRVTVGGRGGAIESTGDVLDAGLAGTTSRFVTALAALAGQPVRVDGGAPLLARPMGPLHEALAALGVRVEPGGRPGHLPVTVIGPPSSSGPVRLRGDVSSQFVTALMLVGPMLPGGLVVELSSNLVSVRYVDMTAAVMAAFGVDAVEVGDRRISVGAQPYRATSYAVEPDASSAGYALAMAAVAGGRVRVPGLTLASSQPDVAFVHVLGRMGCEVDGGADVGVRRDLERPLRGVDIDMVDCSDAVPTLAAVAATASSPTRIGGVGFIRRKESDRLGDLAAELSKTGADVHVESDGLRIRPVAELHGAPIDPHHDHRLAMAMAVLGAVVPGIEIEDPDVVSKSWPGFWAARDDMLGLAR